MEKGCPVKAKKMRVTSNSCIFVVYIHDMWLRRAFKESPLFLLLFFLCVLSVVPYWVSVLFALGLLRSASVQQKDHTCEFIDFRDGVKDLQNSHMCLTILGYWRLRFLGLQFWGLWFRKLWFWELWFRELEVPRGRQRLFGTF